MPGNSVSDRPFLLFLASWFALNLIQAWGTPLDPDEAYYWMYAQRLDWGYFDHPPMVALSIAVGQWLPAELGVRFGTVLLSALTWGGVYLLTDRPQGRALSLLVLLMVAMPMLEVYGFIATPDAPLLFGAVFFWLAYRRFLESVSAWTTLLWAVSMAFLLYSKYHGLLLIGFTVLSNPRLWRTPAFYAAGFIGALIFLPHLYWQWANDFPSFRYHLSGRDDPYELKHTFNYLLNQLLIFNPLLLWWIVKILWKKRAPDALERSFRWVIFGFWLFFLWSTSKGHAEPQWTALLSIPFVVLLFREWGQLSSAPLWGRRFLWFSLGLLVAVRLLLLWPGESPLRQFNQEDWIKTLQSKAQETPVLIENSYRDASLYRFYSGRWAWTTTDIEYRPSQYDLWGDIRTLQDSTVILVGQGGWNCPHCPRFEGSGRRFKYQRIDQLQTVQHHRFNVRNWPEQVHAGDTVQLDVWVKNPYAYSVRPGAGDLPLTLSLIAEPGIEQYFAHDAIDPIPDYLPANDSLRFQQRFILDEDLPVGTYPFVIGWRYVGFPPMRQSEAYSTKVQAER